jgi:hypothetical protein
LNSIMANKQFDEEDSASEINDFDQRTNKYMPRLKAGGITKISPNSIPITVLPIISDEMIEMALSQGKIENPPEKIGRVGTREYIGVVAANIHRPLPNYAAFLKKNRKNFEAAQTELIEKLRLHGNIFSRELLSEIQTVIDRLDAEIAKYFPSKLLDLTFSERAISELGGLFEQLGGKATANNNHENIVNGPFVRFVKALTNDAIIGTAIVDYKKKIRKARKQGK